MRRRRLLAVIGSVGVTTIAGCSGGNNGGGSEGSTSDTTESASEGSATAGDTETTTTTAEPSFGPLAWSQRGGDPKRTYAADVTALTTDSPSTTALGKEFSQPPLLATDRIIWKGGVYDRSGNKLRDLPARTNLDLGFAPQLAYSGGTLTVPRKDELVGVDPLAGEELWRYSTRSPPLRIVARDGTVYAALPDDSSVVAVDLSSGERRWRKEFQRLRRRRLAAGAYLYAFNKPVSEARRLVALDFETGETVTEIDRKSIRIGPSNDLYTGPARVSPEGETLWEGLDAGDALAVDSQYVYVRGGFNDTRTLKAVNPGNGSIAWEFELPSNYDKVVAGAEHVYVAITGSDQVFAIAKANGSRAGLYSVPEPRNLAVGDGVLAVVSGFSGQYTDSVTRTGVRLLRDG
jgi:outer membrane protein assembly factor BamB